MHGNYLEFWQNARDKYAVNQRTAPNFLKARLDMTVLMKGPGQCDTMFYYIQNKTDRIRLWLTNKTDTKIRMVCS